MAPLRHGLLVAFVLVFVSPFFVPSAHSEDAPPASNRSRIQITSPRAGQSNERVATIKGTAVGLEGHRLTLVLNGVPLSIANKNGHFETKQVLAPGWNSIRVAGASANGPVEDALAVYANVPRKDLRITLTWDTPSTDLDLWVTGPDGEKVFYQHKHGQAGGVLDTDVTDGYGPETYTLARSRPGTYKVEVHYYSGAQASRATVNVIEGEGTPSERRRTFEGALLVKGEVLRIAEFEVQTR